MVIGLSCGCCNFYIAENTSQRLRRNSNKNSQFLELNVRIVQTNFFEMSGAVTICLPSCWSVVGASRHQASEQVVLGCDDVWLLLRRTRCSLLYYSTLKLEARSLAEAELPKTLFLALTMTQLYECWVQAVDCWLENCGFWTEMFFRAISIDWYTESHILFVSCLVSWLVSLLVG